MIVCDRPGGPISNRNASERKRSSAIDRRDLTNAGLAGAEIEGGLLTTIGGVNATYVRVMSIGLGESSGCELQRWRALCPFLQNLALTLPIFGETGMDFVRGNRGRKEPTLLGLLPRLARDCPEDQFRAIGVPREAT